MKHVFCLCALVLFIAGCSTTYRPFPFGWYGNTNHAQYVYLEQDTMNIRRRGYSRYAEYEMWSRDTITGAWKFTGKSWTYDLAVYEWEKIDKPQGLVR